MCFHETVGYDFKSSLFLKRKQVDSEIACLVSQYFKNFNVLIDIIAALILEVIEIIFEYLQMELFTPISFRIFDLSEQHSLRLDFSVHFRTISV